jgi:hypothetical protein
MQERNNRPELSQLSAQWRERAHDLRKWAAAESAAAALETAASELDAVLSAQGAQLLSLRDAAELSGYSDDHLGRLIRTGKIPNAGRTHAPKIRRADLPLRPSRIARRMHNGYDPIADARALMSRQGDR